MPDGKLMDLARVLDRLSREERAASHANNSAANPRQDRYPRRYAGRIALEASRSLAT